jgi:two-component system heavy metal sensor histidine kinase CusS
MRTRSITFLLTLYFSIASTAVLLFGGYFVGGLVETHLVEQDGAMLEGKIELVRNVLSKTNNERELERLPVALAEALIGHHDLFVAVATRDHRSLFRTAGFEEPAALTQPVESSGRLRRTAGVAPLSVWEHDGRVFRGMSASAPIGIEGAPPVVVVAALDIAAHRDFMAEFRNSLWLAVGVGVALSALLGWLSARRGLSPARRALELMQRISADRLGERLPPGSMPSELAPLAAAFNDMLARLQDSFRRLSDFSSDLAHELRTPISNLMTQTQVALAKARTADEYREILYSNLEEYERLSQMTSDMLFLAKADNGLIVTRTEVVDLAAEVDRLFAFYEALAEERGVRLVAAGDGHARVDRDMLRRAISNVLSNAIRHTTRGGEIRVAIGSDASGRVELSVENPGADVPPEQLPRLFDRFYRVDAARRSGDQGEGAGLGLAIAKSIVEAHGGAIRATNGAGLFRLSLTVPAG